LERAFFKTYGQDINEVFGDIDHSVSNFRWAVNSLMPTVTRSAWVLKKSEIKELQPGMTARKFHFRMQRRKYYEQYGRDHDKPKFKERMLAFLITILPKVGPLRTFRFKEVGAEGEKQFIKSFDTVMFHYNAALARLNYEKIGLPNVDFDTGKKTIPGEYELTDETYNALVDKLHENKFSFLTNPLKQNIIAYYNKTDTIALIKKDASAWKKASSALQEIKMATTISVDSLKSAEQIQDLKRIKKNPSGK